MADVFELFGVGVEDADDTITLRVRGDLDLATAPILADCVCSATQTCTGDVVVDLAQVGFLDSTALKVLVEGHQRLQAEDRELTVANPSPFVERVLKIGGVSELFDAHSPSTGAVAD